MISCRRPCHLRRAVHQRMKRFEYRPSCEEIQELKEIQELPERNSGVGGVTPEFVRGFHK